MEQLDSKGTPAIVVLSQQAFATAQKISATVPQAVIYSLAGRVPENANEYNVFSIFLQELYRQARPIIALCAAGIIIRTLAPMLNNKAAEPAVIAVAEDGSCVVPLLGVTQGANRLAQKLALALGCQAAVTTSGELRFGINLLCPPADLELLNPAAGKSFVAALLRGEVVRLEGSHPWIDQARLPFSEQASHIIRILPRDAESIQPRLNELVYRQRDQLPRGSVTIVGLGPGSPQLRTFAAEQALRNADDILGYDFYIDLAGPFAKNQIAHRSGNTEELARARQAIDLAARGRHAALVSSGDPGIFGMAAAFFEAWEQTDEEPAPFDIVIEPGISAALAAAARFGAPLGHDFAVISLSDNLKSWEVIEKRLRHACRADLVLALYNPVSKTRTSQLAKAVDSLRQERPAQTIVALAHDAAREGQCLKLTTLAHLQLSDITSRTVVLVGSSKTRRFTKNGQDWLYTPRHYD